MSWYCPRCGRVAETAGACVDDGAALVTAAPHERAGQRIGEYQLAARLGGGAFGQVYRAVHERSGLVVALKLLDQPIDQPDSQRALTEARAAARIRHPSVVQVYDLGLTAERCPYIVMEYLAGETLAQRWSKRPRVDAAEVIAVATAILRGLEAAHARGIVHRDLKPANVFVVGDLARVVVVDFGLAKLLEDPRGPRLTLTGASLGTPRYMAPEQIRNQPLDGRADLYALGVMMFEALAGQPPFAAGSTFELLDAHVSTAPPELPADVPPALVAAIDRALAKAPVDRFATAADMRAALVDRPRRSSRRRWLAAGIAALAIGGTVIGLAARGSSAPEAAAPGSLAIPPPLPGEPPLTREHERTLRQFSVNLVARPYPPDVLAEMACKSEVFLTTPGVSAEVRAFTRRFVALLRTPAGVSAYRCAPNSDDSAVRIQFDVRVPAPLPGDAPTDPRDQDNLDKIASGIRQGAYTLDALVQLLCMTREAATYAVRMNEVTTAAYHRRLLRMLRTVPGLERTTCPDTPPP